MAHVYSLLASEDLHPVDEVRTVCDRTTHALHVSYICAVGPMDSGCANNNQRSLSTVEYKVRLTLLTLYSTVDKDLRVEISCIISFNYCYVCCSGLFFLLIENVAQASTRLYAVAVSLPAAYKVSGDKCVLWWLLALPLAVCVLTSLQTIWIGL